MGYYCGDDFSQEQNLASEIHFLLKVCNNLKAYFSRCDWHQLARKKNRYFYWNFEEMHQGSQVSWVQCPAFEASCRSRFMQIAYS